MDRLRGERDRWKARSVTAGTERDAALAENERLASVEFIHNGCETTLRRDVQAVLDQRDAARAALERVRGLAETAELAAPIGKPPYWTGHVLNALEGES